MTGVILAHPRSGSTELVRALREATSDSFRMEPFHKPKMKRKGVRFDSPEFPEYLDQVMAKHAAIKHMWTGLTEEQNARVLSHASVSAVVFLYRQDALAAALSRVVATMTRKWDRGEDEPELGPLPLDEIENQYRLLRKGQRKYRTWLFERGIPHMILRYEDIYTGSAQHILRGICGLFGLSITGIESGLELLSPENRYNSEEFYRSAPNWNEFERRFKS